MFGQLPPTLSIKKFNCLIGSSGWMLVISQLVMIGFLGCFVDFGYATYVIGLLIDIVPQLEGLVDIDMHLSITNTLDICATAGFCFISLVIRSARCGWIDM